jgi:hypothetical protein
MPVLSQSKNAKAKNINGHQKYLNLIEKQVPPNKT